MLRQDLATAVSSAVRSLIDSGTVPSLLSEVAVEITETKNPDHGDYTCNLAMVAAKRVGMNPRHLAEALQGELAKDSKFEAVDVAGPGFLNFRLAEGVIAGYLPAIRTKGNKIGHSEANKPLKINVEFVSVNPNGPITIGSGRGAAYGSTLCNVLAAAGNEVHREYYINDGVNSEQMRLFAESVRAHLVGEPVPENGYKGDYVHAASVQVSMDLGPVFRGGLPSYLEGLGESISERLGKELLDLPEILEAKDYKALSAELLQRLSEKSMLTFQKRALEHFGVIFDTWFSEQSLHDSGVVETRTQELLASGAADERPIRTKLKLAKGGVIEDVEIESQETVKDEDDAEGAGNTLWLRSTKFGDDMDRVLRRRDGRLTYITSDVAYHADKFNRPANTDKLITILGPDHHGYIGRLHAVLAALYLGETKVEASEEPLSEVDAKLYASPEERDRAKAALAKARENLEVVIYQLVRFLKDGKPAPMRKRDGNIYELSDLVQELGERAKPNGTAEEKTQAGRDIARFFYLMRSHDTTMDFDIDLATQQSDDNPVFYVQYAHARICGVLAKAQEAGIQVGAFDSSLLTHPKEKALLKKIMELPDEVQRCAEDYSVHRIGTYAIELARQYHAFYDACRVIQPEQMGLTQARLNLCQAAADTLAGALDLLGISAPTRMERDS